MTQDEKWMLKYNEVVVFIETNHRNPSRHRLEEHDMLNWVKANRKAMNKGEAEAGVIFCVLPEWMRFYLLGVKVEIIW